MPSHRLVVVLVILVCALAACATSVPERAPNASPSNAPARTSQPVTSADDAAPAGPLETATVLRIVDGDTIVIDRGQGEERLRYIGIDTPEAVDPQKPVEPMSAEASAANDRLVGGREVVLERDVSEVDRFDRLLRHVWLRDGETWLLVNRELVRLGVAEAVSYPPDVLHDDLYEAAEADAKGAARGLWAVSVARPSASPSATPLGLVGGGRDGCEPAYPSVCIPPSPPDLDCADITFRRFEVLPPDPHRFDGGGDGIGCEAD